MITGRIRLRFASFDEILEPGDSYSIPENVIRSLEALEPGTVMDVFTPPRPDYLQSTLPQNSGTEIEREIKKEISCSYRV